MVKIFTIIGAVFCILLAALALTFLVAIVTAAIRSCCESFEAIKDSEE